MVAGLLAERRTAIREGWTPGECELCGADGEVVYIMFADEPVGLGVLVAAAAGIVRTGRLGAHGSTVPWRDFGR